MHKLKTFEQFLAELNKSENVTDGASDRLIVRNPASGQVISNDVKDKMWQAYFIALQEATKYEDDDNPEHTLEGYLSEHAAMMGSTIGNALDSGHFFNTLSLMAAQVARGGDAPQTTIHRQTAPTVMESDELKEKREEVKKYLDECIEAMKESFIKSLDEVKKNNNARSIIVANMLKKNNGSNNEIK